MLHGRPDLNEGKPWSDMDLADLRTGMTELTSI